jgi:hypothetical protein
LIEAWLTAVIDAGPHERTDARTAHATARDPCTEDSVVDDAACNASSHLEQGRLVQGLRVLCPSARTIGVVSLAMHDGPTWSLMWSGTWTYTTRRDVTRGRVRSDLEGSALPGPAHALAKRRSEVQQSGRLGVPRCSVHRRLASTTALTGGDPRKRLERPAG